MAQYVVSLTACALIAGILLSLFREGSLRSILRIVCGILLMYTALSPIADLKVPDLFVFSETYLPEGEAMAAAGAELAREETHRGIQRSLEAYILDKADALGAAVHPVVKLDDSGIPVEVWLDGSCPETARKELTDMITKDLGIPEEDQKWTEGT